MVEHIACAGDGASECPYSSDAEFSEINQQRPASRPRVPAPMPPLLARLSKPVLKVDETGGVSRAIWRAITVQHVKCCGARRTGLGQEGRRSWS